MPSSPRGAKARCHPRICAAKLKARWPYFLWFALMLGVVVVVLQFVGEVIEREKGLVAAEDRAAARDLAQSWMAQAQQALVARHEATMVVAATLTSYGLPSLVEWESLMQQLHKRQCTTWQGVDSVWLAVNVASASLEAWEDAAAREYDIPVEEARIRNADGRPRDADLRPIYTPIQFTWPEDREGVLFTDLRSHAAYNHNIDLAAISEDGSSTVGLQHEAEFTYADISAIYDETGQPIAYAMSHAGFGDGFSGLRLRSVQQISPTQRSVFLQVTVQDNCTVLSSFSGEPCSTRTVFASPKLDEVVDEPLLGVELPQDAQQLEGDYTLQFGSREFIVHFEFAGEESVSLQASIARTWLAGYVLCGAVVLVMTGAAVAFLWHSAKVVRTAVASAKLSHKQTIAYLSHELRNPVHAASACLDAVTTDYVTELSPALQEDVDAARSAMSQIASVLDDILDLRIIQDGSIEVRPRIAADLGSVWRDLAQQYRSLLAKKVKLVTNSPVVTPIALVDTTRLRQLVGNGLHNAAKHTLDGYILLLSSVVSAETIASAVQRKAGAFALSPANFRRAPASAGGVNASDGFTPRAPSTHSAGYPSVMLSPNGGAATPATSFAGEVPWLMIQVLNTAASSLPAEVVELNKAMAADGRRSLKRRAYVLDSFRTFDIDAAVQSNSSDRAVATLTAAALGDIDTDPDVERVAKHLRERSGTGLGLTLCRRIVAQMHGMMGVEQRMSNRGRLVVNFWVAIPLQPIEGPASTVSDRGVGVDFDFDCEGAAQRAPVVRAHAERYASGELPPAAEIMTRPPCPGGSTGEKKDDDKPASRTASYVVSHTGVSSRMSAASSSVSDSKRGPMGTSVGANIASRRCKSGTRVLLVDDEAVIRRLGKRMLDSLEVACDVVADGEDAYFMLVEAGNPNGYTVVLMDIVMRRSNGVDVAQRLRNAGISLPMFALTGNVEPGSIEAYKRAGFDGMLGKPFGTRSVMQVLKCAADVAAARAGPSPGGEPPFVVLRDAGMSFK